MTHIKTDRTSGGIAVLTLDHANSSTNLISPEWAVEFSDALDGLFADDAVKGIVITSAKDGFMAGADLDFMSRAFTTKEALEFSRSVSNAFRRLETGGKPVAAVLVGAALGGGFELALACHRRFFSDDPAVQFGLPEVNVGLLPGAGGTQRLQRLLGAEKALDLLLGGRSMTAAEAVELGIGETPAPGVTPLEAAFAWLASGPEPLQPWDRKGNMARHKLGLLDHSNAALFSMMTAKVAARTHHNYPAQPAILSAVFEGMQLHFDKALEVESKYFARLLSGDVAQNIVRTVFVNRRRAQNLAARPKGVAKMSFGKIGILGAGMMGAGIAYSAARAGSKVVLIDRNEDAANAGKEHVRGLLDKLVQRDRTSNEEAAAILDRILPTTDYTSLQGANLVVEAVFEDSAVKADVIKVAAAQLSAEAVFASNTSTLPITGLAENSTRPERFIGLHFFSPVERMPLVEMIIGKRTSQETIAHAMDFVGHLRKLPILVKDSRGFYTSRVFLSYVNEGVAMLDEGIPAALIENAARFAGMPTGPLAVTDEVSLDLPVMIAQQAKADLGENYREPCGYGVMTRMISEFDRHGRKYGAGFYEYGSGGKRLWPELASHFPSDSRYPSSQEIGERLLHVQALEAVRCVEEGVIEDPRDADLGSIFGIGFPTYTGGTLSYVDTVGIGKFVERCEALEKAVGERFKASDWLKQRAAEGLSFHG
ncbi:MAG: enoyl-CoA hydratase/isomerase family protein [Nitratireductor sp.]|nr:enoyl-CoA hydratase/isomerase family protein [Nitratireductor sp.]